MNYLGSIPVIFLLVTSCGSHELQVPTAEAYPPTFTSIRDRIFIPRCANCHSGIVSHKVLLSESSDSNDKAIVPGNSGKSLLYQEIKSGQMPLYGETLTSEEKNAIKTWIDNGAKND